jgi:hypothetical protein
MKESEDELGPRELRALNALARETAPPDFLEQRIVSALRESNLIRASAAGGRRPAVRIGSAIAASLALFFLGALTGSWWRALPAADERLPEFMLVLLESPEESPARSSEEALEVVREYGDWAKKIRNEGLLVGGEKLKDEARFLSVISGRPSVSETQPDANGKSIGGYFLIRARDYQQAMMIAEGCPHLNYGGVIEIRQIDSIGDQSN